MECFFYDVAESARGHEGEETMFADDLSIFEHYPLDVPNYVVVGDITKTLDEVHKWGRRNRVEFDRSKERIVISHVRRRRTVQIARVPA